MTSDLLKTGGDFHGIISATCFAWLIWRMEWLEGRANYAALYPQERCKRLSERLRAAVLVAPFAGTTPEHAGTVD